MKRVAIVVIALLTFCASASELYSQFNCDGVMVSPGQELTVEVVVTGLSSPVDLQASPGDTERVFVVQRNGLVRIVDITNDTVGPTFLDISARVTAGGELGLLGLAFHPNYEQNGYFYVNYTRDGGSGSQGCGRDPYQTVISRFQVSEDPDAADESSEKILLVIDQPYGNHNGGQLAFGPLDGYLYIGTGDGGSGGDPCNSGQTLDTLLGKMLRIDVDVADDDVAYEIPDNHLPEGSGARAEIWAFGLRNPWRYSFDPGTPMGERKGDLYIADVGQNVWEEVDYLPAGSTAANFGWRLFEGAEDYPPGSSQDPSGMVFPIFEYHHNSGSFRGRSVTGGVVYRGCSMPDLAGAYFVADYSLNWVAFLRVGEDGRMAGEPTNITREVNDVLSPNLVRVSSFGVDGRGEVYVVELGGRISRIVSVAPAVPSFRRADANDDRTVDITDGIVMLQCFFLFENCPSCLDAGDANDDGQLDIVDAMFTLFYMFGGPPPPAPGPTDCGPDEDTGDFLGCETYSECP